MRTVKRLLRSRRLEREMLLREIENQRKLLDLMCRYSESLRRKPVEIVWDIVDELGFER